MQSRIRTFYNKLTLALYREYSSAFFGEFIPDGGVKGSHGLASSYPKTCLLGFLASSAKIIIKPVKFFFLCFQDL